MRSATSSKCAAAIRQAVQRGKGLEWATDALAFQGFGPREKKQAEYARLFLTHGRYDVGGAPAESPDGRLKRYRTMLAAWEKSADKGKLTREDVLRIAEAVLPARKATRGKPVQ